ncbi:PucR family transcriptional regulator ligand-binding domain-containing protein [Neobacillus sp. YIM B06451]|uniref:PucR family transcriptional regulator n=1 Tax=Neobacillus sp. YIM B06451 TaxID=3070994 RepID=UPI002931D4D0|nr:PucR family transcriptional regulator ligand-binding domain-containing protein [Neobacillus sp. YIM B06451]
MEFKVKDLLKVASLKDAVILSGKNNLNKVITGATIMEAPDITDWLKGGELILTSLYPIRNFNDDQQEQFINRLADKGVSALLIKNLRFVDGIPEIIIRTGEKNGLPILQLPKEVPYIDVMYPVMGEIVNNQVKKLQYYKNIHDKFTALSLADEGPEKIIETLEGLIGNSVALFDRNFHCITSTESSITRFQIVEKIPYYDQTEEIKFPHYRQIVKYPELDGQKGYQIVVPIETVNNIKTYLLISEMNKPLEELDFIAVENAATALSLELVKQFAVAEVDKRFKNDLLEELIEGKIRSTAFFQNANLIGWDIEGSFVAVLFKISKNNGPLSKKQIKRGMSNRNETLLYEAIHKHLPNCIVGSKSGLVVILWKIEEDEKNNYVWMDKIKETAAKIQQSLKKQHNQIVVQVGLGNLANGILKVGESYKKAQEALELGEILNGKEAITAYSELGIYRLLCEFDDPALLQTFIPPSLNKLLSYPQSNKNDLLETLKIFLECNQNATKVSQLLYIHHKTAVYRLERIKEITGMNFDDSEELLSVQVGLKIIDLLERKKMYKD